MAILPGRWVRSPYEDIARVARAATEPLAPADRAAAVLEELRNIVPYDHAEIAVLDPFDGRRRRAGQRRLRGRHARPTSTGRSSRRRSGR